MTSPKASLSANFGIYFVLSTLAATSAALPVYVHLHPNRFGPPLMKFYGAEANSVDLAQAEPARIANALLKSRLQLDQLTTGSIEPPAKRTQPRRLQILPQPLPAEEKAPNERVEFISATKDRALAFVDGKLRIFTIGDHLPDGRIIKGFELAGSTINPVAEPFEFSRDNSRPLFR